MDRSPSCTEALLTDDARSTKAVLHCVADSQKRGTAVAATIALEVSATPIMPCASGFPARRGPYTGTGTPYLNLQFKPPPYGVVPARCGLAALSA